ncbi:hypothetical protein CJ030_MR8G002093 [Morella rubra]|uniref:Uncharacterized protein n=1 Tax=Morella rubra TaxID=262757 RepID=A0A6A1URH0_9ROSI|nr:hypothetical protein CJ030_MR8G002093 [Morella rubra]
MKVATEKKKQGLPYGMLFTHMFHILKVGMIEEIGLSSIFSAASSREPHLSKLEDSIAEIKEEQRKLSKNMKDIATSMKLGFEDIKKLHVVHTKHFGALDKEMRGLKHQVNNSIHVTRNVFPHSVDEFASTSTELQAYVKSSAENIIKAT